MYLPQFFKENYPAVRLSIQHIKLEAVKQYQQEERSLIARRLRNSRYRLKDLLDIMCIDQISTPEKVEKLKHELADHFQEVSFLRCRNMGEILKKHLKMTLLKPMQKLEREATSPHNLYK